MILPFPCFHKAFKVKIDVAVYFTNDMWFAVVREEEEVLTDNETSVTLRVMLDSRYEQDISPF
jgi:hypothetical protein